MEQKTILKSILIMLLWGSLFPVIKLGYKVFSIDSSYIPNLLLFAGIRFLLCGAVLLLFCAAKGKTLRLDSGKNTFRMLMVALTAVVLHYGCTYTGLSMVDSGKTALLKQLGAVLFICFSFLFFKEDRFTVRKLLGALLGICGIVVLNTDSLHFSFGLGEGLVIAASFCTVIANIFSKHLTKSVAPTVIAGETQFLGGVILLIAGLCGGGRLGTITVGGVFVFLYIIVASSVSYGLWYEVIQKENLSNMFIIKFLEPVFAGLLAVPILGERFGVSYIFALLLTFAAILVSGEKRQTKKSENQKIHKK